MLPASARPVTREAAEPRLVLLPGVVDLLAQPGPVISRIVHRCHAGCAKATQDVRPVGGPGSGPGSVGWLREHHLSRALSSRRRGEVPTLPGLDLAKASDAVAV